jgi:drug/metabolite transporter (DMT)-like permease
MNPIIYLLFGTLSLGFAEAFTNKQLKKYSQISSIGLMLVGNVVTMILAITWALIFGIELTPLTLQSVGLIILIGIVYSFANKLYFSSYKIEAASSMIVLMMISIVVSSIFGRIVFNEQVSLQQWLGIFLVIVAVLLISTDGRLGQIKKNFEKGSGKLMATQAAIFYGLGFSLTKLIVQDIDPHYYQLLDVIVGLPMMFILFHKESVEQTNALLSKNVYWKFVPLILFFYIYNKAKYVAFSQGVALPVADAIDNTVVFVILAIEFFILQIKQENYVNKLFFSLLAFVGILLISI